MTTDDFTNIYWSQYILLEKEFTNTLFYLALDNSNDDSYSQAYSKLMLEIGSEVDVVFKEYCRTIDSEFNPNYRTIGRYKDCIKNCNQDFIIQEVSVINHNRSLFPWQEWNTRPDAPWWWTAYNKIKHQRTSAVEIDNKRQEAYKFANQKYTLLALAGLYQIMIYFYYYLAEQEGKKVLTPLPGSRLFKLCGNNWDNVGFYMDSAFYMEEGHLFWETGTIQY